MLMLEAQARLYAGQLDLASERLAEAERVGGPADAMFLWRRHTVFGDTAMLTGRPRDALEHYSRSLEEAQARGNEMQIMFDLMGVAIALADVGEAAEAIEVLGIANKQMAEMGGADASAVHLLDTGGLTAARARLGAAGAEEQEARGRAVPATARVARACELARATPAPVRSS
jgi:ATP/maltotriose-dependent transcriptional regulator MalT